MFSNSFPMLRESCDNMHALMAVIRIGFIYTTCFIHVQEGGVGGISNKCLRYERFLVDASQCCSERPDGFHQPYLLRVLSVTHWTILVWCEFWIFLRHQLYNYSHFSVAFDAIVHDHSDLSRHSVQSWTFLRWSQQLRSPAYRLAPLFCFCHCFSIFGSCCTV